MAAAYRSRDLVEDYMRYKLLGKGLEWRGQPGPPHLDASPALSWRSARARGSHSADHAHTAYQVAPPPVQVALRCAGNELQRRFSDSLTAQAALLLRCGGSGVDQQENLTRVREELFRDEVNWGRIVAMMELGGALCTEAARAGRAGMVDDITRWLEDSLDSPLLQGWIETNGGWDAFVELYGHARPPGRFWSLRMMIGLAVLGAAGFTLGALFSQK